MALTRSEIISMTLNADLNGDGEIDFQEFVKHFTDVLDMMSFDQKLQAEFNKMQKYLTKDEIDEDIQEAQEAQAA